MVQMTEYTLQVLNYCYTVYSLNGLNSMILLKTTNNIAYLIIISKRWCAMPTLLCLVKTKTMSSL